VDARRKRQSDAAQGQTSGEPTEPAARADIGAKIRYKIQMMETVNDVVDAPGPCRQIMRDRQGLINRQGHRRAKCAKAVFCPFKQACSGLSDRDPVALPVNANG
jgi:hypothetical protein